VNRKTAIVILCSKPYLRMTASSILLIIFSISFPFLTILYHRPGILSSTFFIFFCPGGSKFKGLVFTRPIRPRRAIRKPLPSSTRPRPRPWLDTSPSPPRGFRSARRFSCSCNTVLSSSLYLLSFSDYSIAYRAQIVKHFFKKTADFSICGFYCYKAFFSRWVKLFCIFHCGANKELLFAVAIIGDNQHHLNILHCNSSFRFLIRV